MSEIQTFCVRFLNTEVSEIQTKVYKRLKSEYSRRPKSGHPVFGAFHFCPVAKHVRFSKSGHKCPDFERPNCNYIGVQLSDIQFQLLKSGQICPVFRRSRPKPVLNRFQTGFGLEHLKTGHICPVIGRSVIKHCPKSGRSEIEIRTFDNRT